MTVVQFIVSAFHTALQLRHIYGPSFTKNRSTGAAAGVLYCWVGPPDTPALAALQLALGSAAWMSCSAALPGNKAEGGWLWVHFADRKEESKQQCFLLRAEKVVDLPQQRFFCVSAKSPKLKR